MSLTGPWTVAFFAALALATPAAALVFWNRISRRQAVVWPVRGLMLFGCQLTACLLVGVLLNDYGQFYTSWPELFGNAAHGSASPSAAQQLAASVQLQLRAQHHQAGHSAIVSIPVVESGRPYVNDALVYLPAAYFESRYRSRLFPVVELFDGFPGSPRSWQHPLRLPHVADAEIAAGRAQPFVAVMPVQNYLRGGRDGECLNVPDGAQVETTLTTNVRKVMLATFRVASSASNWALMGFSMGGYCAMNLAMRHPQWYSTAASISGYTHPFEDFQTGPIFVRRSAFRDTNDPLWRLRHLPVPPLSLLLFATKPDRPVYSDAVIFARYVKAPLTVSELLLPRGGHNFPVVISALPTCLDWVSAHIGAPTAPGLRIAGRAPHVVTPNLSDGHAGPFPLVIRASRR